MKIKNILYSIVFCIPFSTMTHAQIIQPHFDKEEFIEVFQLNKAFFSITAAKDVQSLGVPYQRVYISESIGLDNQWALWEHKTKNLAAICIRGTGSSEEGWLENFYAAMTPATGSMVLAEGHTFSYSLAADPRAAVHIGWLIGVAYLSQEILPRVQGLYDLGVRDFYICGHSQGAAISQLLHAYLLSLQRDGTLPEDIYFKSYSSATPKTGNLYFAYYFESCTQRGDAYSIISTADWVPEVPISIQTLEDMNEVNPFQNIEEGIRDAGPFGGIALRTVYHQLTSPLNQARDNYQKYLGKEISKVILKKLPDMQAPGYYPSNNYTQVGPQIVLFADQKYHSQFPADPSSKHYIFTHHLFSPYEYLLDQLDI